MAVAKVQRPIPLPVRLNNPGALRPRDADPWQGRVLPSAHPGYVQFKSMRWGIRAMAIDLTSKIDRGVDTVLAIISAWAPPSDNNDTMAYVADVASRMGVHPQAHLLRDDYATMRALVLAITHHESGYIPYSEDDLAAGLFMAGYQPEKKPLAQSKTIAAAKLAVGSGAGGIVAGAGSLLTQAVPAPSAPAPLVTPDLIDQIRASLEPLAPYFPRVMLVVAVLSIIGGAIAWYRRRADDAVRIR